MKKKYRLILVAAACIAAAGTFARAESKVPGKEGTGYLPGARIAVVSKDTKGEFWSLLKDGMTDTLSEANRSAGMKGSEKLTMTFEGPADELDVETQINTLDAVISENPAVLCLCASDMNSCQAQLEMAADNGIPVVIFDSGVTDSTLTDAYRGTDNYEAGRLAARELLEAVKTGNVAVFSVQEKTETLRDRVQGFLDEAKNYPDVNINHIVYQDQVDDIMLAMEQVLTEDLSLTGVFCSNADIADLYLEIDKPEDREIVFVGTDATSAQQSAISGGTELGCVSQDPYEIGRQTMLAALHFLLPPETAMAEEFEEEILLEPRWINAENMTDPENEGYLY